MTKCLYDYDIITNSLIDLKEAIELHKNSLNIVNDLIRLRMNGGETQ